MAGRATSETGRDLLQGVEAGAINGPAQPVRVLPVVAEPADGVRSMARPEGRHLSTATEPGRPVRRVAATPTPARHRSGLVGQLPRRAKRLGVSPFLFLFRCSGKIAVGSSPLHY